MPSPRKPTVCPLPCRALSTRDFCSGVSLANTVRSSARRCRVASSIRSMSRPSSGSPTSRPTSRQIFALTTGLSPVSTFTATPFSRNAAMAGPAVSFGGSRKVSRPAITRSRSSLAPYWAWDSVRERLRVPSRSTRKPSRLYCSASASRARRRSSSSGRSTPSWCTRVAISSISSTAPLHTSRCSPSLPSRITERRRRTKSKGSSSTLRQASDGVMRGFCSTKATTARSIRFFIPDWWKLFSQAICRTRSQRRPATST